LLGQKEGNNLPGSHGEGKMMKFFIAVVLSALPLLAAESFTGTRKEDLSTPKFSGKPSKVELSQGIYKCLSCQTPYTAKADGKDQHVSGQPSFDTINVRIIDDHSLEIISKMAGKVVGDAKETVSSDGMTETVEGTYYPMSSDKPVAFSNTSKRVGGSIAGMHAISGSWRPEKVSESEEAKLNIFEQTSDGLKWSAPTGEHYEAKLDGKEYPVSGARGWDKVVLKRLTPSSIEETDKFGDKTLATYRYTLSSDGRSMTMEVHGSSGGISTSILRKQ
jgi:hypothetical protein